MLNPKDVSDHTSGTVAPIFTNGTSFFSESWDQSNKTMKSQKILWPLDVGPRNYIGPFRALQNSKINPLKLWNLKNFLNLGSGVWKLYLGHLGQKDVSDNKFRTLAPIFQNRGSFYPER